MEEEKTLQPPLLKDCNRRFKEGELIKNHCTITNVH